MQSDRLDSAAVESQSRAAMAAPPERVRLQGFNNLSKVLSCNLWGFFFARSEEERNEFVREVDGRYCADRIASILTGLATRIDAEILNVSARDYEPHGASGLVLIGEDHPTGSASGASVGAHLDKSHICAHTFPDWTSPRGVCSFRVDVEVATCGTVVPLHALDQIFAQFASDVAVIDYVVRGFTRDVEGRRVYVDHDVESIRDFIDPGTLRDYRCEDLVLRSENIWQTRMMRTSLKPADYFPQGTDLQAEESRAGLAWIEREMAGLFARLPA
jgi:S-adenosylmethionine decarboxylase